MDHFFDNLSRTLAGATSRRDALRSVLAMFGGTTALMAAACANPASPSDCSDGCVGSDKVCYTCASGFFCSGSNGSNCGSASAGGIRCCTSSTGGGGSSSSGGGSCPCASGQAWNATWGKCCPG